MQFVVTHPYTHIFQQIYFNKMTETTYPQAYWKASSFKMSEKDK